MSSTAKQQLSRNPQNAGYSNPIKTYPVPAVTNEDGTISVPAQPVYGIDPNHEPIDMYMATRDIPGGTVVSAGGTGAIGAGGIALFVVPAGQKWLLLGMVSDTTMSATVGNRILQCRAQIAGAPIWIGAASAAVAAAQVGGYDVGFNSAIGTPSTTVRRNMANTANTNVQVREMCPLGLMGPGYNMIIADSAAVDAADSVNWNYTYVRYDL